MLDSVTTFSRAVCSTSDLVAIADFAFKRRADSVEGSDANDEFDLRSLDLHGNSLTVLPKAAFAELQTLRRLNLDGNLLTSLQSGLFAPVDAQLRELSIRYNRISFVYPGLASLPHLESLDLAKNRLTRLDRDAFAELFVKNGLRIDVEENPFNCLCKDIAWYVESADRDGEYHRSREGDQRSALVNETRLPDLETKEACNVSISLNMFCKDHLIKRHLKCVFDNCPFDKEYILKHCGKIYMHLYASITFTLI